VRVRGGVTNKYVECFIQGQQTNYTGQPHLGTPELKFKARKLETLRLELKRTGLRKHGDEGCTRSIWG
jgi:hypothetical protein